MNIKKILSLFFIVLVSCSTANKENSKLAKGQINNCLEFLIKEINNANSKNVIVISHRGDWRNYPENSLEAMASSIAMGVDMVEMDVAKTKDNQLIIMLLKLLKKHALQTKL